MRAAILLASGLLPGCALYDGLAGGGCDATPFFQPVNQTVPDNNLEGISSSVNASFGIVSGVTVSADTEHRYPGELNYRLIHNGFFLDLDGEGPHDISEFDGMQAEGVWTMQIFDDVNLDAGTWYSWELAVCVE